MITVQYVLLHFFLLCILFFFCNKITHSQNNSSYWKHARFPIIAFTLEEGLRWGRETDWSLYYNVYQDFLDGYWTNHEPLFQLIWKIFAYFHFPYPVVISFCSFLFIFSVFYFFRPYKNICWLAIPLCIASHLTTSSNTIRWYMALSIILIAITLIHEKKYAFGYIIFSLAPFIHLGAIILYPFYLVCQKIKCIARPSWAIITCIILILVFDDSLFRHFSFLFYPFRNFERFSGYFSYGEQGLFNSASEQKTMISTIIGIIPNIAFIVYGYKLMQKGCIKHFHYNMIVLGTFMKLMCVQLELFIRFYYALDFFICLGASYTFIYLKKSGAKMQHIFFLVFILLYFAKKFFFMIQPYDYEEYMMYVWNDNLMSPNDINAFRNYLRN